MESPLASTDKFESPAQAIGCKTNRVKITLKMIIGIHLKPNENVNFFLLLSRTDKQFMIFDTRFPRYRKVYSIPNLLTP